MHHSSKNGHTHQHVNATNPRHWHPPRTIPFILSVSAMCFVLLLAVNSTYTDDPVSTIPSSAQLSLLNDVGMNAEDDVFLRRPDWRHGRQPVRVLIMIMSNRANLKVCAAVASAYLGGIPIIVTGYGEKFTDFMDKLTYGRNAIRQAKLAPRDVVVTLDDDVLFTSAADFVLAIDRFIALSPETPDELSARTVRDGSRRMMAPVTFGAEVNCFAGQLFLRSREGSCTLGYERKGVRAFRKYHERLFPNPGDGGFPGRRDVNAKYLNSGFRIARVWAANEFDKALNKLTTITKPSVHRTNNPRNKWTCDQSAITALYLNLLRVEVAMDALSTTTLPLKNITESHRLRPGLIGLDYDSEFVNTAGLQSLRMTRVDDRFWRPSHQAAVKAHADTLHRHSHVPCGMSAACPSGDEALKYLRQLSWTALGASLSLNDTITVTAPNSPSCARNVTELLMVRNAGSTDSTDADTITEEVVRRCHTVPHSSSTNLGGTAASRTITEERVKFAFPVILPRTRVHTIPDLPHAPPMLYTITRLGDEATTRQHLASFVPLLHYAGGGGRSDQKKYRADLWLSYAPWLIPANSGGPALQERSHERLREYLAAMPIELWSSTRLTHENFGDICLDNVEWI